MLSLLLHEWNTNFPDRCLLSRTPTKCSDLSWLIYPTGASVSNCCKHTLRNPNPRIRLTTEVLSRMDVGMVTTTSMGAEDCADEGRFPQGSAHSWKRYSAVVAESQSAWINTCDALPHDSQSRTHIEGRLALNIIDPDSN